MSDNKHQNLWRGWETVGLIGHGSYGTVYEIQRVEDGKTESAAVKVISIPQNESDIEELYSDGYDDQSIASRFQENLNYIEEEYRMMREMSECPNVVHCDEIQTLQHEGRIGWDVFIKMELLTPLPKALPAEFSEAIVVKIAKDMCTALEACKAHKIIHRDVKPQNIFLSPNGDYKLGDFGIAKMVEQTMSGTMIGTYKYMAPEVYHNRDYGSSVDLYSLGLVLYWLLNERKRPFLPPLPPAEVTASMEAAARERRFKGDPIPPPKHGSEELKAIVLKACAYDPKDRYASAAEMRAALNELHVETQTDPVPAPKPDPDPDEDIINGEGTCRLDYGKKKQKAVPQPEDEPDPTPDPEPEPKPNPEPEPKPDPEPEPTPKKKPWWLIAVFFEVAAIVLLVLLFLKNCDGTPGKKPDSTSAALRNVVESIAIKSAPAKTEYFVGEALDTTGLILTAVYKDGTSTQIDDGFTCEGAALDAVGTYEIVVTYQGATTTFSVNVIESSVAQIRISKLPEKTAYFLGDAVDTTGLELTVIYDNGAEKTITEGFDCEPEVCDEEGTQTITIHFGGQSASYDVEVMAVTLTKISIQTEPEQRSYYVGDTLDKTGLTLLAEYSNGETQTITNGFTCDPMQLTVAGDQKITVTYGTCTAIFKVKVQELEITSIRVCDEPYKMNYIVGDTLNVDGITFWLTTNRGETEEKITSNIKYEPTTLNSAGWQKITVTYKGSTTTFQVYVDEKLTLKCSDLTISDFSKSYNLYSGPIDVNKITWSSSNTRVAVVSNGWVVAKSDGTATITATYKGQKVTCIVRCKNANYEVANGTCGNNASWSLDSNGVLTIQGSGKMDDYASDATTPWQQYNADITKIVIKNGITSIGARAFNGCNATSVQMANSVTTIGKQSFASCAKLSDVQLSNNLETIGRRAFISCKSLTTIKLPASVTYIDDSAFEDCLSLRSVYIYNPNCEFGSVSPFDYPEENPNLTIYSYDGRVKQWARSKGYTFVQLN